jgi:hypothetical protein
LMSLYIGLYREKSANVAELLTRIGHPKASESIGF